MNRLNSFWVFFLRWVLELLVLDMESGGVLSTAASPGELYLAGVVDLLSLSGCWLVCLPILLESLH